MKRVVPYVPVAGVVCAGVLLTVYAYHAATTAERARCEAGLRRSADAAVAALRTSIEQTTESLRFVNLFFRSSQDVRFTEFSEFAGDMLREHDFIRSLVWAPTTLDQGAGNAAGDFNVEYVLPEADGGFTAGMSICARETWRATVDSALQSEAPAGSAPFELGDETAILIVEPVFATDPDQGEATPAVRGVLVACIAVDALMWNMLGSTPWRDLRVQVYDTDTTPPTLVFTNATDGGQANGYTTDGVDEPIGVCGQSWTCTFQPSAEFAARYHTWGPVGLLVGGGALTLAASAFTCSRMRRAAYVNRLVQQRTGELSRLNAELRDEIVERQRAQEAMAESERRHRELYETLRDGCAVYGLDGRIAECNAEYCRMLGYTDEELRRLTYYDLSPQRWHAESDRVIGEQVIVRGYSDVYAKEYTRKDGTTFPVEVRLYAVRNSDEQMVGVRAFVRDITERKAADDLLRISETRLSQITQGTSIPIIVIDQNHVVTHWNKACENLTGIAASEVLGTDRHWAAFYDSARPLMADLVVGKIDEASMSMHYGDKWRKSSALKDAYEVESFFPHLGERGRWLFFTAAPLRDPDGNVIGAIETFQDVSERRQAEEELRQRVAEISEGKHRLEVLVANVSDRERRMVALKQEVNDLLSMLGREPKYHAPAETAAVCHGSAGAAVD